MNKRLPLVVAGIVFSLVALIHLLRLFYGWEITIAGLVIPMALSIVGVVVAIILAFWMFITARTMK